jgi:hypothetical protein
VAVLSIYNNVQHISTSFQPGLILRAYPSCFAFPFLFGIYILDGRMYVGFGRHRFSSDITGWKLGVGRCMSVIYIVYRGLGFQYIARRMQASAVEAKFRFCDVVSSIDTLPCVVITQYLIEENSPIKCRQLYLYYPSHDPASQFSPLLEVSLIAALARTA